MKEHTCCIIGHSKLHGADLESNVFSVLEDLIQLGVTHFLNGGMGEFDWLCARQLSVLKEIYKEIESCLVIPYLNFQSYDPVLYDTVLFPALENCYYKKAIIQRNRYMVDSAAHAVCYVKAPFGGAAATLAYAKKQQILLHPILDE